MASDGSKVIFSFFSISSRDRISADYGPAISVGFRPFTCLLIVSEFTLLAIAIRILWSLMSFVGEVMLFNRSVSIRSPRYHCHVPERCNRVLESERNVSVPSVLIIISGIA